MTHNKFNTDNLKINDAVYIGNTNAVGFVIDGGFEDEWNDTCRTDTDGVQAFKNLYPFKFSDLQTPEVFVPTSFIIKLGIAEKVKKELAELYGKHEPDNIFEEFISQRDVIANEERLPCGLLVRHRVKYAYHGFHILQEAEVRSAVQVRNDINRWVKYPVDVGVTEEGKTIMFLERYYANDGKIFGKHEVLTQDNSGFYLAAYNYDRQALKELGWSTRKRKEIEKRIKKFSNSYDNPKKEVTHV